MMHVLLVEDDSLLRYALERWLRANEMMVHSVSSAHEAVALLDSDCPVDVIVTDIMLGENEAHGISLVQMARLRRKGIGVVFISAYAAAARHAERHGMVLMKPVDPSVLVQAIQLAAISD